MKKLKNENGKVDKAGEEVVQKTKSKDKGTGSEKLATEKEKSQVPPFPKAKKGVDTFDGSLTEENQEIEESDFEAFDLQDFCQDFVGFIGDVARIFAPKLTPVDATQKKLIGKPMSKVITKHKLDKLCKDEFLLIGAITYVGYKKVQELKKVDEGEKK